MTAAASPATSIARRARWSSGASGVVACASLAAWTPPIRVAAVPVIPVRMPAASSAAVARNEVVVLPSVPVIPTTASSALGSPYHQAAAVARAGRVSSTTSCGRSTSGRARSTSATEAPARAAAATKSWPSAWRPGTATNSDPGPTSRESWVTPRTGISARPAAPIARPSRRAPRRRPSAVRRSISPPSSTGPEQLGGGEELGDRRLGHRPTSRAARPARRPIR